MNAEHAEIWLEVALNGAWGRDRQPLIPISVRDIIAEGIACARAGAAIVHIHAYDEKSGLPSDDAELYIAIIEGIRAEVDAIVYPTVAFKGEDRYAFLDRLAGRGLLEWMSLDPGSVNLSHFADMEAGRPGTIYANEEKTVRRGLELARDYGLVPSFACYEPGFIRMGAALHRAFPEILQPIYRLMFSDRMSFGFPPLPHYLETYRRLLEEEAPAAPVMIAGLDVNIDGLVPYAVSTGMHVRVGLEDAHLRSPVSNIELVHRAVAKLPGRPATANDVRAVTARSAIQTQEKQA